MQAAVIYRVLCDKKGIIQPFLGSAVNNCLRRHLTGAKLNGGETPPSFRLSLSNTLNMLGCLHDDISRYLGWRSGGMARHYTRMSKYRRFFSYCRLAFPLPDPGVSSQQPTMYCLNHDISLILPPCIMFRQPPPFFLI